MKFDWIMLVSNRINPGRYLLSIIIDKVKKCEDDKININYLINLHKIGISFQKILNRSTLVHCN